MASPAIHRAIPSGRGGLHAGRIAELAEEVASASIAPPPPPPPPARPAVKQWRHPMTDKWDRQISAFAKRSGALPPPEDGMTRLYRAGAVPADSPPRSAEDIISGPFGGTMTRRQLDMLKGDSHSNPLEAEGRWFTDAPDELDFYIRENDHSPVYYLDLPARDADEFRADKTPFSKNSRNHLREFVLPVEQANRAKRLLEGLTQ